MTDNNSTNKRTIWKRALTRTTTLGATGAVILVSGGLVFGGVSLLAERADAVLGPEPAPTVSVDALSVAPQTSFTTTRIFHGQVEAAQIVQLAFEQGGEVEQLLVEEGAQVRQGDLLARLDTRLLDAERDRLLASRRALEAQAELARLTTDRQMELRERGFASEQTVDANRLGLADVEARLAEIDAAIVGVDVRLSQTEIRAPFDGQIGARLIDAGTVVSVGQPVVSLLENGDPLFRVGIDPALADGLTEGMGTTIALSGIDYPATFESFRPDLDAQTRTRTALFRVDTDDPVFLQAGKLTLNPTLDEAGYAVPLSALQDGVRGLWTVLTLQQVEGTDYYDVRHAAVEVMQLEGQTAFVRGTLQGDALIIPNGTHRVVPGERVQLTRQPQILDRSDADGIASVE